MLFIALMKVRAGTEEERLLRRLHWENPEGFNVVAEYWLHSNNPHVVLIFEASSFAPIAQVTSAWDDIFDITIIPAATAEEGLELARKMLE
ncbi:DUF3303 domain-containing protein [Desulfitibacter alkalitolerans]|uniref:DUF3303 domain-containing protein n=1 Tax=Desulfitibacter alkalitolerans TaxID=264641 RepID=UPI000487AD57|nr:DUF3303 family protein [Desulfitibacter alkalitolerans]